MLAQRHASFCNGHGRLASHLLSRSRDPGLTVGESCCGIEYNEYNHMYHISRLRLIYNFRVLAVI